MRIIIAILLLFTITACSTPTESTEKANGEVTEEVEELSALEEISKVCLEGNLQECNEIYKSKGNLISDDSDEQEAKSLIEGYSQIHDVISNEDSYLEFMNEDINEIMEDFNVINFNSRIKKHDELGNKYFAKLLKEKIQPLSDYHRSKTVEIGMNYLELIVALGVPNSINSTTTADGVSRQLVYRDLGMYVYLENGIVTSYQN